MTNAALPAEAAPRHAAPWLAILFVAGAFFIVEHNFNAADLYDQLTTAGSLDEIQDLNRMFQPRAWRQLAGLALGGAGLFLMLRRRRSSNLALGFLGGLLIFYLAWNTLSLVWSDAPAVTLRRVGLLYMLVLAALGLTAVLSLRDILLLAVFWPAIYVVTGFGAEVAQGDFTPWAGAYRFAGTLHPNAQGVNCAILVLAAICYYREAEHKNLVLLTILVGAGFLYLTKSRTAVTCVVGVLLMHWGILQSRSAKVALASAVIMLVAAFLLLQAWVEEPAREALTLGRTDVSAQEVGTLTGRRDLWDQLSGYVAEAPVLGFGYGAFWNEERSNEIIDEQGWPISHAHNAYFDVLLEAGPIALVTYALLLIAAITLAISYLRQSGNPAYTFFSILLLFCALNSLLESASVQRSQLTLLLLIVLTSLAFREHPKRAWYEQEAPAAADRSGGAATEHAPAAQPVAGG
ncbi:MAG: O-antigen ligase family protein [Candidatus Hydrogenedentota bacterium]